ncbi:hypothetical protein KBX18_11580 [Corynebacterium sp. CCUG 69979]|uniref:hypothetical protein n=1 Tax=Corynebacterium sp. CCUG 69979 TaxID=2823890 RepID=UPI00210E23EA|nr:hypothetical protein [Corynebacterium sp. CCUG 69979]MCQ4626176.1 hypothetical protein [Corynebacterium sp. CCUG 69979]
MARSEMARNVHPTSVREGSMAQFVETWQEYSSPSAAAAAVAKSWGIGRTTLSQWLRDEGKWPHTRVSANLRLAAENRALRKELNRLKGKDA